MYPALIAGENAVAFITVATVKRLIAKDYAKIGARGRAEAVAFALRHGFS